VPYCTSWYSVQCRTVPVDTVYSAVLYQLIQCTVPYCTSWLNILISTYYCSLENFSFLISYILIYHFLDSLLPFTPNFVHTHSFISYIILHLYNLIPSSTCATFSCTRSHFHITNCFKQCVITACCTKHCKERSKLQHIARGRQM
jgi:hypothetical protein